MTRKNYCIACIMFCVVLTTTMPLTAETDTKKDDHTPEPYTKEEFPLWQRELRRFEILSFGALPFVTLMSFWAYDIIRYAQNASDPRYYPWPLKQAHNAVPLTEKEQLGVFFSAVGVSITIGIIDITYRAIKRSAELKRLERENLSSEEEAIQFIPVAKPKDEKKEDKKEAEIKESAPQQKASKKK